MLMQQQLFIVLIIVFRPIIVGLLLLPLSRERWHEVLPIRLLVGEGHREGTLWLNNCILL